MKLFPLMLAIFTTPALAQTTWYVDALGTPPGSGSSFDPYTGIQYAIEQPSTVDGDTILVRPGVYVENVDFVGKAITVTSVSGAPVTSISAPPSPAPALPAVTFADGEGPGSVLTGFTVTEGRGASDRGGGISCYGASPIVQGCSVTQNYTSMGAVWAEDSSVSLRDCQIVDNVGIAGAGFVDSSPSLADCVFSCNGSSSTGGAIVLIRCDARLERCTLTGNSGGHGSAVFADLSSVEIVDSDLIANSMPTDYHVSAVRCRNSALLLDRSHLESNGSVCGGGAVYLESASTAVIRDTVFIGNFAGSDGYPGGAIRSIGADLQVSGSYFADNSSVSGGAVSLEGGTGVFLDSQFVENHTYESRPICCGEGGAIAASASVGSCVATRCSFIRNRANGSTQYAPATGGAVTGPVVMSKCTIIGNYARDGGGGVFGGDQYGGPGGFVEDCIVWGNSPDQIAGTASVVFSDVQGGWPGTGNIDADPLFIDAQNDNLHLAPGSPCIDAGNRAGTPDLDGSRADVGAFQFVDCNDNGVLDSEDIAMGTSTDLNGNAFPDECECLAYNYCETAPHSTGEGATMNFGGTTSVLQNDLVLLAETCPPNKNGIFFYGTIQNQFPFGDGWRCVFGQVLRLTIVNTGPQGIAAYAMNYSNPPQPAGQITPGSRWNFQFWFRDPAGPGGNGFNLTDGLEVVFCE